MSRVPQDHPLTPSVLDRLIDPDPGAIREAPKGQAQVLREMRLSLRRDLENLLNTRWRCVSWPPQLEELDLSLVNYGIPDFTGQNMAIPVNREEFRRLIERVVRKYEPRLKNVKVSLLSSDSTDRALRFRIEAVLQADSSPEPIVFDSSVDPTSGAMQVRTGQQR